MASPAFGGTGWTWGFNVTRLELSDAYWFSNVPYSQTDPTPCGTVYKQTVADVVNQVTSRGMIALMDLHAVPAASTQSDVPPSALECTTAVTGVGHPSLRPMADAAYAPQFWSQVATAYKDNPLVAFGALQRAFRHSGYPERLGTTWIAGTIPPESTQTPANIWHDGGQLLGLT